MLFIILFSIAGMFLIDIITINVSKTVYANLIQQKIGVPVTYASSGYLPNISKYYFVYNASSSNEYGNVFIAYSSGNVAVDNVPDEIKHIPISQNHEFKPAFQVNHKPFTFLIHLFAG